METLPGTWREPHRDVRISFPQAIAEWAEASIPILEEVARSYNSHITYSDLASRVMEETGIRTGELLTNFSGKRLNRVIHICLDRGLPALSSLVVTASDGTVGSGFNEVAKARSHAFSEGKSYESVYAGDTRTENPLQFVELRGFEPLTSSMRTKRSTN